MCKIQQSIILARKLKQKAVNIKLSMLFVFCWRIVKVFSYTTICVVHCVTPLYLKTAGIDSPQILRSIQLLLQPEDSYNYAEQAAVYSSVATALAWGLSASFARSIRVPGCGALFVCLECMGEEEATSA